MSDAARHRVPSALRRPRVGAIFVTWLAVVVAWTWFRWNSGRSTTDAVQFVIEQLRGSWWAVFAFVALSMARPFVLVPATLLTMAAGLLFGPIAGIAVAMVGANASALLGHAVGRGVDTSFASAGDRWASVARWRTRLVANGFESVLVMRLVFLPFDAVNYAAGYLGVGRWSFLTATAIGSLPGTVSFVLLGASLSDLADGTGGIDRVSLIASILLIVASLVVARVLRRRTRPPSSRAAAEAEAA